MHPLVATAIANEIASDRRHTAARHAKAVRRPQRRSTLHRLLRRP